MPPVLDVAFHELAAGGAQEMLARDGALGHRQGHHVLELVAKSVGAAGLIEGGPGPDPADQRLVQEPLVEHHVHGTVGRPDLNGADDVIPLGPHRAQREVEVRGAIAAEQGAGLAGGGGLAQEEPDLLAPARRDLDQRLKRRARIQAGPDPSGGPVPALQQRGMIEAPVATEHLGPVTGPCRLAPAEVGERDAVAEVAVPGVPRQQRPRIRVDLGDDERGGRPSRDAQHPLDVRGHREAPGGGGAVLDRQPGDLHGVLEGHELEQIEGDAVGHVLEPAVALTMPGDVGRGVLPDRERGRGPRARPCPRRERRAPRPEDRSPDRWTTPSADSRGCSRTTCTRRRTPRPESRSRDWRRH